LVHDHTEILDAESGQYLDNVVEILKWAVEALERRSDACFQESFTDCSHQYQLTLGLIKESEDKSSPQA